MGLNEKLIRACKEGNLEQAKQLHELGADVRANYDECLIEACSHGYLAIAMWLYDLGADTRCGGDHCLMKACEHGHLEMAKWLHSLGANVAMHSGMCLRLSMQNDHHMVGNWLRRLGVNPHEYFHPAMYVWYYNHTISPAQEISTGGHGYAKKGSVVRHKKVGRKALKEKHQQS